MIDLSPLDFTEFPTLQELNHDAEILPGMGVSESGVPISLTRDEWLDLVTSI